MKLEIGDKVDLFEKDGFETDSGKIIHLDSDFVYVKGKIGKYKISHKSMSKQLVFTTKGNSLEKYKL